MTLKDILANFTIGAMLAARHIWLSLPFRLALAIPIVIVLALAT